MPVLFKLIKGVSKVTKADKVKTKKKCINKTDKHDDSRSVNITFVGTVPNCIWNNSPGLELYRYLVSSTQKKRENTVKPFSLFCNPTLHPQLYQREHSHDEDKSIGYSSLRIVVRTIASVTRYGSQLLDGRRSSR